MSFDFECKRLDRGLAQSFATLRDFSRLLQQTYDFPGESRVDVRLNEERAINARAFREAQTGVFVVEFTLGLVVWLDAAAATIALRSSDVLAINPTPPSFLMPEAWRPIDLQAQLDLVTAALPEDHLDLWQNLFQSFLLSIFAHEVAHVVRGHLSFAKSLGAREGLDELALRQRRGGLPSATVRLLEFDADAYAAFLLGRLVLAPPDVLPRWRRRSAQDSIVELVLGSTLFFAALEVADQESGDRAPAYPEPLLRMITMLVHFDQVWQERFPEQDFFEAGFEAALSVIVLLEPAYPQVDVLRQLLQPGFTSRMLREAEPILSEMEAFEHLILEHAFDGTGVWPPPESEE